MPTYDFDGELYKRSSYADLIRAYGPPAIVPLGLPDAGELLTLQRAAYITAAADHNDFHLPPLTETLAGIKAELADPAVAAFGVREGARRLIGSVRLRRSGTVVELGRLIVAPDRQGQGIGTRLLSYAETVFPGAQEIRLFTGEHSTDTIRLYERLGYQETGRTSAGHYQLVHFTKLLG